MKALEYIETLRTDDNSKWINKYIKVLNAKSNKTATKYNKHHIVPCFVFKNKSCKGRRKTESSTKCIENNLIKLSIGNHVKAHYYLWKIFNNAESKIAFQLMSNCPKYVENVTEKEINEIATLIERCAKENKSKEDKRLYDEVWHKKYYAIKKDEILNKSKKYYADNKDKILEKASKYRKENKKAILEHKKQVYYENSEEIRAKHRIYHNEHKEELSIKAKERYERNKEQRLYKCAEYRNQMCIDPIKGDKCTLNTLNTRIFRNKMLYDGISREKCIVVEEKKMKY